jgi:DNA invertase Pin-like site-specific DNA recombinase
LRNGADKWRELVALANGLARKTKNFRTEMEKTKMAFWQKQDARRKVVALARVSTETQELQAQITEIKQICADKNLELVHIFTIQNVSGKHTMKCPEMHKLLDMIRRPDIVGLVMVMSSRMMRVKHLQDFGELVDALRRNKITLIKRNGETDLSTMQGIMMAFFEGMMAGEELNNLKQHAWNAKEHYRKQGRYVGPKKRKDGSPILPGQRGSQMPIGCQWDDDHGWKYLSDAYEVAKMYDLILSGLTNTCEIQRRFPKWGRTTIDRILRQSAYMGIITTKKWAQTDEEAYGDDGTQRDKKQVKRPENKIIHGEMKWDGIPVVPPVSPEKWHAVQKILNAKASGHYTVGGPKHTHHFTYTGFTFCNGCGGRLKGSAGGKKHLHRYYMCSFSHSSYGPEKRCVCTSMRQDRFEPIVDEFVTKYLTSRDFLKQMVKLYLAQNQPSAQPQKSREEIQAQIKKLLSRKDRTTLAWTEGDLSTDAHKKAMETIKYELEAAEAALETAHVVTEIDPAKLVMDMVPFRRWAKMDKEAKRAMLAKLKVRLFCQDYRISRLAIDGVEQFTPSTPLSERGSEFIGSAIGMATSGKPHSPRYSLPEPPSSFLQYFVSAPGSSRPFQPLYVTALP